MIAEQWPWNCRNNNVGFYSRNLSYTSSHSVFTPPNRAATAQARAPGDGSDPATAAQLWPAQRPDSGSGALGGMGNDRSNSAHFTCDVCGENKDSRSLQEKATRMR